MPRLSDSMEEGTIVAWLAADGDEVELNQEIVEIETDKATMAYESDFAGTLEIIVPEGETAALGEPIAKILTEGESDFPVDNDQNVTYPNAREVEQPEKNTPQDPDPVASDSISDTEKTEKTTSRIKASPLAKRIANANGIDLKDIKGSGTKGRIVKADIESLIGNKTASQINLPAAQSSTVSEQSDVVRDLTLSEKTILRRMTEAKQGIPHFYLETDVRAEGMLEWRKLIKAALADSNTVIPSFNDLIVKASASALRDFPLLRTSIDAENKQFNTKEKYNIGIAVATKTSLLVPTIKNVDRLSLTQIAEQSRAYAQAARDNRLSVEDMSDGVFTVSNLGMFGVKNFSAIINAPESAILAVGAIRKEPVVNENDEIDVGNLMSLTLSCDHRVFGGAEGAKFLNRLRQILETPDLLLLS